MLLFKKSLPTIKYYLIYFLSISLFVACNTLKTAPFDIYSYQETLKIKEETLKLIETSTTSSYTEHEQEISELTKKIEYLKNYEKNRSYNSTTIDMWNEFSGNEKNLITDYFSFWKKKNTVSPIFANESKRQISTIFEIILTYEVQKKR
ncbi:hypothetical protein BWK58_10510 [Flavobacterium columnare]|nr:hypothetical protein BWK58_10510 [Flavobacterium columnare]